MEFAYRILQVTKDIETFHTPKHATSNNCATFCFTDDVFQEVRVSNWCLRAFLAPICFSLSYRKWRLVALWSVVSYKIDFLCLREIWKIFRLRKNVHRNVIVLCVGHPVRIGRLWVEREPGTNWKAADGVAEDISRYFARRTNENVQWR